MKGVLDKNENNFYSAKNNQIFFENAELIISKTNRKSNQKKNIRKFSEAEKPELYK